jgi:hypothetical protein
MILRHFASPFHMCSAYLLIDGLVVVQKGKREIELRFIWMMQCSNATDTQKMMVADVFFIKPNLLRLEVWSSSARCVELEPDQAECASSMITTLSSVCRVREYDRYLVARLD